MRQIILDTETTGIDPREGHRLIEIGAVEMVNRRLTGRTYHQFINPEREIEEEAISVHGITNERVAGEPLFAEIADEFWAFIEGGELVIHNAPFDVGFIDHELTMLNASRGEPRLGPVAEHCRILDTLQLARDKHPGQRNNLDALCKRYEIDNGHRVLHGALLDAEILAEVYLAMTGGQTALLLDASMNAEGGRKAGIQHRPVSIAAGQLRVSTPSDQELAAHRKKLASIREAAGECLWDGVKGIVH
ncbi:MULTISPECIES: DNA polymerase III subunit epsilon [Halomonas]|uniref:DNA polymerase III subunit epsilon n=2 Tax=Halomonas TaxID=2745 RepID=A0A7X4VXX3_9GAMM|nr:MULTISPECIES: DNA polymerase III subunit epsilon [Halomonas]MDR5902050.1 DNA polymerase III subunit epsilon [Halomonas icarae]NAW12250.1 DNA polymerase III subunit epsilon [Halomonas icarae]TDB05459.1 DNA polymerase III subunit epsilon [Halomonas marinisediminis]